MDLMLAALVFLSAIVLLFAKELETFIQKVAAIPGIKLTLPLLLVSFFIETYDDRCAGFLLGCQTQLNRVIQDVVVLLPFKSGADFVSEVLFLVIIACMPVLFVWLLNKKVKHFRLIVSPFYLGYLLWIMVVFLLITNF